MGAIAFDGVRFTGALRALLEDWILRFYPCFTRLGIWQLL